MSGIKIRDIARIFLWVHKEADIPKTPEIFCYPEESAWDVLERMEKENRDSLFIFDPELDSQEKLVLEVQKKHIILYAHMYLKKTDKR